MITNTQAVDTRTPEQRLADEAALERMHRAQTWLQKSEAPAAVDYRAAQAVFALALERFKVARIAAVREATRQFEV
jgi:hypothetical protein